MLTVARYVSLIYHHLNLALDSFTEVLAQEVLPNWNIRVCSDW